MGLLSFFQTRNLPGVDEQERECAAPVPTEGNLWRRNDFSAAAIGDELVTVFRRNALPVMVPSFAIDFVMSCSEFRPLAAHVADYADNHSWGSVELGNLHQWLPRMIEAGILLSAETVVKRCSGMRGKESVPPISSIGFPTGGNRVPMLERALVSFAENLKTHSRLADLLVADSSADRSQRDAYRGRLSELNKRYGDRISYAGEEEKRRFAKELIRRTGCDPSVVEFALFDPLEIGFACGANRNALLLHEAGRLLCSVDDDVVCRIAAAPDSSNELSLFSRCDPFSRWLYPDRESAFATATFVERDFLQMHEAMLGQSAGALVPDAVEKVNVAKIGEDLLRRLDEGPVTVRSTFTGHVGDPGIPSSIYFLYFEGENRKRLVRSEEHYRSVFGSRSVFTVVANHSLGDASVSPGMAMGLDHRELLPPFFPVLHAEDFIYGATLWQCVPRSVLGHVPFAVSHEPAKGKALLQLADLGPECRAVIFEFAHLVRRIVLSAQMPATGDPAHRMGVLGRYLREIAAAPASDFIHFVRGQILEHESEKLMFLERQRAIETDAPEFWLQDVERFIEQSQFALTCDDFDVPFDLKPGRSPAENRLLMQRLFAEFGALLCEWPALVEAAKEMRQSDPLFRPA